MILVGEPAAALRVISVRLLEVGGAGLPLDHVFSVGDVKVRRPGAAAFVNAVNLPTAITGGAVGSFELALDLAEVAVEGVLRVQFAPAGGQFLETTAEVRLHPLELVLDADAAAGAGRTAAECINIIAAYASGNARGMDGPVGSFDSLATLEADRVKRIEFTIQSGARTITARRGA